MKPAFDMNGDAEKHSSSRHAGRFGDWHAKGGDRSAQHRAARDRKRLVRLLLFVLPALALSLVAATFLWTNFYADEEVVPLTFTDVGAIDDDLRMISPRITGTDKDDRPFTITADTALQDQGNAERIRLNELQADMTLSDGSWLSLSAAEGLYLVKNDSLELEGRVSIFSDIGYELHAEQASIDLKAGSIVSSKPISGQGPLGEIEAGGMSVIANGDRLRFENGVHLTLYPEGN